MSTGHHFGIGLAVSRSIRSFADENPILEPDRTRKTFQRYRDFKFARWRHFAMAIRHLESEITVKSILPGTALKSNAKSIRLKRYRHLKLRRWR